MAKKLNTIPAAVVIPPNLTGKRLKVVTTEFMDGNAVVFKPLKGKKYDDNTPILIPIKDMILALGGEYTELDKAQK